MILKSIELKNFRGFGDQRIELDEQLTVLVGMNGAGKTSVLDAIAILLDQYSARLLSSPSSARRLSPTDPKVDSSQTKIRLTVDEGGTIARWSLVKQGKRERILRPLGSEFQDLNSLVRSIANSATGEESFLQDTTLAIYYDQRRALVDIPKRKRGTAKHSAQDAFAETRAKRGLDFRGFTYWFQERESEELRRQRKDRNYEDSQLKTVRRAIATATDLKDLTYSTVPPRGLCVSKGKIELHVEQLSTGERAFLSLAGDLARRLSMVSSDPTNAHRGRAIVLIDEIELHLHPLWQREIIPWLLKAFPKCQFVVTTHSPQVIGEIEAHHLRVLDYRSAGNAVSTVDATLGRDSNYILRSTLGASERSASSRKALQAIEVALVKNDLQAAQRALAKLSEEVEGSAPEIAIAEARIQRRSQSAQ
jgi:predicted ATP-binding protein involved in virulence